MESAVECIYHHRGSGRGIPLTFVEGPPGIRKLAVGTTDDRELILGDETARESR